MGEAATPAIHLIENLRLIRVLDVNADEYESGYWFVPVETAQRLHGAHIYFHPAQAKPSFCCRRKTVSGVKPRGCGA